MIIVLKNRHVPQFTIVKAKILFFKILKQVAYNASGFTFVIIVWGSIFIVLRQPWKYLIKKKHGLVYCSIYLLLLVIIIEEYAYFSLIREVQVSIINK